MLTRRSVFMVVTALVLTAVFAVLAFPMATSVLAQGPTGNTTGSTGSGTTGSSNTSGNINDGSNTSFMSSNEANNFTNASLNRPAASFALGVIRAEGYQTYTINIATYLRGIGSRSFNTSTANNAGGNNGTNSANSVGGNNGTNGTNSNNNAGGNNGSNGTNSANNAGGNNGSNGTNSNNNAGGNNGSNGTNSNNNAGGNNGTNGTNSNNNAGGNNGSNGTNSASNAGGTFVVGSNLCASVRVYRVTEWGDLILHPSTCNGTMLSFTSVGTGAYVLYAFGTMQGAQNAPVDVLRFFAGNTSNQR